MTFVNTDCNCIEQGECTCEPDFCVCECGCDDCLSEYTGGCGCGENCGCDNSDTYLS